MVDQDIERILPICSYCKAIKPYEDKPNVWRSKESLSNYDKLMDEANLSYGMCPPCEERVR
jgi:hypothetical protein